MGKDYIDLICQKILKIDFLKRLAYQAIELQYDHSIKIGGFIETLDGISKNKISFHFGDTSNKMQIILFKNSITYKGMQDVIHYINSKKGISARIVGLEYVIDLLERLTKDDGLMNNEVSNETMN